MKVTNGKNGLVDLHFNTIALPGSGRKRAFERAVFF